MRFLFLLLIVNYTFAAESVVDIIKNTVEKDQSKGVTIETTKPNNVKATKEEKEAAYIIYQISKKLDESSDSSNKEQENIKKETKDLRGVIEAISENTNEQSIEKSNTNE